jgi:hypothetical protein
MIAKLGQCLRGCDADTGWNTDPLQYAMSDLAAEFGEIIDTGHTGETFVYRIDFNRRYTTGDGFHHPTGQVSIEFVVAGKGFQTTLRN